LVDSGCGGIDDDDDDDDEDDDGDGDDDEDDGGDDERRDPAPFDERAWRPDDGTADRDTLLEDPGDVR
jgi:hypothetical protein